MAEQTVTVFGPALELMKSVKSPEGEMLTKPFLDVCRNVLPVIGVFSQLVSALLAFVDLKRLFVVLFCVSSQGSAMWFGEFQDVWITIYVMGDAIFGVI